MPPQSPAGILARRLGDERTSLCDQWLRKLVDLLPVEARQVFPSRDLLDHVPLLLAEIAAYIGDPSENEISVSSIMEMKARDLGQLRFHQNASVHQILREYDLLVGVLEEFLHQEMHSLVQPVPIDVGYRVLSRLHRAVRLLMQTTVDTFVASCDEAIGQQQRRLEDFNRMVSHEMRGPMNTLSIASSLLAATETDAEGTGAKAASLVRRGIEQMARVLDDLESLSGVGSLEKRSPAVQEVEVGAVARDVAAQLADLAQVRGVKLRVAEDLPVVMANIGRLQMVLANLLANAVKYSDPDKSERWVEVTSAAPAENLIAVEVRDNGLGIAEEDRQRIFARFFRAHRHLDSLHDSRGSGLGLAIVKECVTAMGGEIEVESAPGVGSVFRLRLPRG